MKILSVNVGRPRPISIDGRTTLTGIYKNPVPGPVQVNFLNLEADEQADLSVHGGVNKAVYAYPSEHYVFWRERYPTRTLEWGAFGENLTTEGLLEDSVSIGDKLQIGSAILTVVQPRQPCYKLAGKFQDPDILQAFLESGRSGIYFSVEREGQLQAGDAISWVQHDPKGFTIADANRLLNGQPVPRGLLEQVLRVKALPDSWRRRVVEALEVGAGGDLE